MVKQGGTSKNTNASGRGSRAEKRCSICSRSYVMEWAKNNHERVCKEYNHILPQTQATL